MKTRAVQALWIVAAVGAFVGGTPANAWAQG
jgi:hypothetical protein